AGNGGKYDRRNYALLEERFGMLASAGSDFHRLNDFSGGILGACPELPENCRPVWAHFSRY
ncbi:phosphatase, partial [Neisseria meningitidis]